MDNLKAVEAIGKYFSAIRHEIMVNIWKESLKNEQPFAKLKANDQIMLVKLDAAIYETASSGNIQKLISLAETYRYLFPNKFWQIWMDMVNEVLNKFTGLSPDMVKNKLLLQLPYVYNKQYTMLTQRIGVHEFAEIIAWDKKKLSAYKTKGFLPQPVQIISASPLWTVGQAEQFRLVLENRRQHKSKARGDWKTMLPTSAFFNEGQLE